MQLKCRWRSFAQQVVQTPLLVEDSAAAGVVLDVLPESSAADAKETAAATAGSSAGSIKNNTID